MQAARLVSQCQPMQPSQAITQCTHPDPPLPLTRGHVERAGVGLPFPRLAGAVEGDDAAALHVVAPARQQAGRQRGQRVQQLPQSGVIFRATRLQEATSQDLCDVT